MPKKKTEGYHRVTFTHEGKRYERKGKTPAEAHEKAAELKAALKRGDMGASSNMTVKAWAEEWLEVYKRPAVGESQYISIKGYINNALVPAVGRKKIKDVKDIELQKIINSKSGNSKSDLSKLKNTIQAIFRRAHASGLIPKNPAEYLELPAAKDGTRRAITGKERKYILALADKHYAGLWVKLTLYCGLRPNEARALDWRHVDFENKLIHIEQGMKSKTRKIGEPKSKAGVRDVPIPDIFLPDLQTLKKGPFEPVVTKVVSGKRHDERSMTCMWKNFKRELDISMGAVLKRNKIVVSVVAPDLVPYCLRHTYCTALEEKGVAINIAKYLMGHSDIATTARVYTHTTAKSIQDAADKINGVAQKENSSNVAHDVAQNPQILDIG